MILNCHDRSDQMSFVMKTRQNNNLIDRTGTVYAENKIELSWPIGLGGVYNEN